MSSKDMVAIFWDYENCPPACNSSGYEVVDNIRRVACRFGDVSLFKAYLELMAQSSSKSLCLRSELQSSGVSLTDCPHNGRKDVADKMMLVDMLAFAIDNHAPATIILISGDRDFAYAVSVLRLRRYYVVVVAPPTIHESLKLQASMLIDWNCEILGKDDTGAVTSRKSESLIIDNSSSLSFAKDQTTPPLSSPSILPIPAAQNSFAEYPSQDAHTPPASQSSFLQCPHEDDFTMRTGDIMRLPSTTSTGADVSLRSTGLTRLPSENSMTTVESRETEKPPVVNHFVGSVDASRTMTASESGSGSDHTGVYGSGNTILPLIIDPILEPRKPDASSNPSISIVTPMPQKPLELEGRILGQVADTCVLGRRTPSPLPPSSDSSSKAWSFIQPHSGAIENPFSSPLPCLGHYRNRMVKNLLTCPLPALFNAPAAPIPTTRVTSSLLPNIFVADPSRAMEDFTHTTANSTSFCFHPIPSEFQILVKELRRQAQLGRPFPTRSIVAVELVKQDKSVYQRAKVNKFKDYIALAVKAQIVIIGGTEGDAWISLKPNASLSS